MRNRLAIAILTGAALCAPLESGNAGNDDLVSRGAWEYHEACAVCHGPDANGDGTMGAILKVPPPDLTRLSERNGGVFPFERVFEVIDGRMAVEGHGSADMPVWGRIFTREALNSDPDLFAAGRIYALAQYLRAVQGGRKVPMVAPSRPRRGWPSDIPVWPDRQ